MSPEDLAPPKADFSAPPPYEVTDSHPDGVPQSATLPGSVDMANCGIPSGKLPTYEEVQMEKSRHGELPPELGGPTAAPMPPPPHPNLVAGGRAPLGNGATPALTFIAIDAGETDNMAGDNSLLGTDIVFVTAFLVAFLFNWIGFLMLTCFCHTIAARYGALSGFGLSLAKWTLIVKHSTDLASHENSWLWWLIMAFGFLICVRALVQYISIKRTWRLLSASAQERLLFFY
ncbi:NEDD4 family-interacting protein 1 [Phlebotomus argentipes]|uniref:NEDD4 family-interacting protein 1 n=1 Tax=Phlebotomus argentipes TaxID=94469 RepID=UPI0028931938|nr:NEDD4 family-interacting protein 1 [Phlebotomus argentipes]